MKKLSVIYVLIAGIMWGLIGLFVRGLDNYSFGSMEIVFFRALSGTFLMGMFLLFYNRNLFKIKIKDIWCFVGTGIISLTFFNICYFKTISMTSLAVAAILLYTAPSIVMILSLYIFKERMTVRKIISVIMAFVGCVFVTGVLSSDSVINPAGILLGLGSGFGYALYSIFARFALNKGYHSFTVTFYTLLMSGIGTVAFFEPGHMVNITKSNPSFILVLLLFGLVSTVLPYIFYTLGLSGMEAGKASIIASIEPVTATLLGITVFGESMSFMSLCGALIVLASIVIVNINAPQR